MLSGASYRSTLDTSLHKKRWLNPNAQRCKVLWMLCASCLVLTLFVAKGDCYGASRLGNFRAFIDCAKGDRRATLFKVAKGLLLSRIRT